MIAIKALWKPSLHWLVTGRWHRFHRYPIEPQYPEKKLLDQDWSLKQQGYHILPLATAPILGTRCSATDVVILSCAGLSQVLAFKPKPSAMVRVKRKAGIR